jgi:hypothetical protein
VVKNEILNKNSEIVASYLSDGLGWKELEDDFRDKAQMTIDFAKSLLEGFSPKQIIDQHMSGVPESTKILLKEIVHTKYLEATKMNEVRRDLLNVAKKLNKDIIKLLVAWDIKDIKKVKSAYNIVRKSASAVNVFDEKLPKGVALP